MLKTFAVASLLALAPLAAAAQVTLTAETTSPGSTPHYIDTTLAAALQIAGIAKLQITEGATLTNSVKAVAEGQLDMAPAPMILPFLLARGIGPYSGVGPTKGAELAGNMRALFFSSSSAFVFTHFNKGKISGIADIGGKRIWNGPPRGAALTSGRALIGALTGLQEGKDYEGVQTNWPDMVSTITGGGVDGWASPEGLPSGRQITIAASGGITIYDMPSDVLKSELGQKVINAPGHARYSVPLDEYRAAYKGSDITIVSDDDTFDTFAVAFAQVVHKSMDDELAYAIAKAFLDAEDRFRKGAPIGQYLFLSFGDIDGVREGACGLVKMKMHPGAIRAYKDAGHTIADCLRP